MKRSALVVFFLATFVCALQLSAQNNSHNPTWWNKYQYLLNHPAENPNGPNSSISVGANVDVSNECGPQSETFIAINPKNAKVLAAGSNEMDRLRRRGGRFPQMDCDLTGMILRERR